MKSRRLLHLGVVALLFCAGLTIACSSDGGDDPDSGAGGGLVTDGFDSGPSGTPTDGPIATNDTSPRDALAADVLVVAPPPMANPGCVWLDVMMCNTRMNVATYCDDYRVGRMQKCDGTLFVPDAAYQAMYNLCSCAGGTAGSCCTGVAYHRVECCSN